MLMNMEDALSIAQAASQKSAQAILAIYNTEFSNQITIKSDNSPLTQADTASNEIIKAALTARSPTIPILSEENPSARSFVDSEYCWIVDPLDGTKEFINKNGEFTVNIALTKNHHPILGVIHVPVTGTVFYAVEDRGAFKQTRGSQVERIRVTEKTDNLIWVGSKSHSTEKEQLLIKKKRYLINDIMSVGSSLKGIMVAEGKADVYYRFGPTCEWDTCAMQCIAEEAGGIFRQMDGSKMSYNRSNHLNEIGFYIINREENIWV